MNRSLALLLALIFILSVSPTMLWADEKATEIQKTTWQDILSDVVGHYPLPSDLVGNDNKEQKSKLDLPKNWEVGVGVERFIASHTSYDIGLRFAPWTKPLSRLEFPVNTWWLNFDARRTCPRWSIGGRAGFSVNRNSNNWMIDSDWRTNDDDEDVLTNYSKNYCDVRKAFLFRGDVDVNISDWLKLPPSLEIRPLFAFQFQRFNLIMHDGVQWNYVQNDGFVTPLAQQLPGDCVSFRQDWWLYMIGLRGSYNLKLNKYVMIKIKGEADWGPALGYNVDHHMQREGDLWGYINSSGNALYFLTGLDMTVSKTITIGVGVDYLRIRTSGIIHDVNTPEGVDQWWSDDVKSYSDQLGLTAHISYAF